MTKTPYEKEVEKANKQKKKGKIKAIIIFGIFGICLCVLILVVLVSFVVSKFMKTSFPESTLLDSKGQLVTKTYDDLDYMLTFDDYHFCIPTSDDLTGDDEYLCAVYDDYRIILTKHDDIGYLNDELSSRITGLMYATYSKLDKVSFNKAIEDTGYINSFPATYVAGEGTVGEFSFDLDVYSVSYELDLDGAGLTITAESSDKKGLFEMKAVLDRVVDTFQVIPKEVASIDVPSDDNNDELLSPQEANPGIDFDAPLGGGDDSGTEHENMPEGIAPEIDFGYDMPDDYSWLEGDKPKYINGIKTIDDYDELPEDAKVFLNIHPEGKVITCAKDMEIAEKRKEEGLLYYTNFAVEEHNFWGTAFKTWTPYEMLSYNGLNFEYFGSAGMINNELVYLYFQNPDGTPIGEDVYILAYANDNMNESFDTIITRWHDDELDVEDWSTYTYDQSGIERVDGNFENHISMLLYKISDPQPNEYYEVNIGCDPDRNKYFRVLVGTKEYLEKLSGSYEKSIGRKLEF